MSWEIGSVGRPSRYSPEVHGIGLCGWRGEGFPATWRELERRCDERAAFACGDMAAWTGRTRTLLMRAWLRPLVVERTSVSV